MRWPASHSPALGRSSILLHQRAHLLIKSLDQTLHLLDPFLHPLPRQLSPSAASGTGMDYGGQPSRVAETLSSEPANTPSQPQCVPMLPVRQHPDTSGPTGPSTPLRLCEMIPILRESEHRRAQSHCSERQNRPEVLADSATMRSPWDLGCVRTTGRKETFSLLYSHGCISRRPTKSSPIRGEKKKKTRKEDLKSHMGWEMQDGV